MFTAHCTRSALVVDGSGATVDRALPLGPHHHMPSPGHTRAEPEEPAEIDACSIGAEPGSRAQETSRRTALFQAAALAVAAGAVAGPAEASKAPPAVEATWQALGGGPPDLAFPDDPFLGVWDCESVLTSVELPLGPEFVPDMEVVQRAREQDLNRATRYAVRYARNGAGRVVLDRGFNTAALVSTYMGIPIQEAASDIIWQIDDPNSLTLQLPGGTLVGTRVMRRLQEGPAPGDDRLATSEFIQQTFDAPGRPATRVKASRCFTKFKWRSAEAAGGGPQIVATQVVSDYLTGFDDPGLQMRARGEPVVVYSYRLAFTRAGSAAAEAAAAAAAVAAVGEPP